MDHGYGYAWIMDMHVMFKWLKIGTVGTRDIAIGYE